MAYLQAAAEPGSKKSTWQYPLDFPLAFSSKNLTSLTWPYLTSSASRSASVVHQWRSPTKSVVAPGPPPPPPLPTTIGPPPKLPPPCRWNPSPPDWIWWWGGGGG